MICTYHNSPIAPSHKPNVQGNPADVLVTIFGLKSIGPVLKGVDHFVFFNAPLYSYMDTKGAIKHFYSYDLASVLDVTKPLGIPWHPIESKS